MQLIKTGQLSGVTGLNFTSGVSTPPIFVGQDGRQPYLGFALTVYGDPGWTGGSVAVVVKASASKGGSYHEAKAIPTGLRTGLYTRYILKSGTSTSSIFGTGHTYTTMHMVAPWIRLHAIAFKSATTKTTGVTYSVFAI